MTETRDYRKKRRIQRERRGPFRRMQRKVRMVWTRSESGHGGPTNGREIRVQRNGENETKRSRMWT